MKLHQNPRPTTPLVTGFGDGYLQIGDRRLTRTLVLGPGTLREDWGSGNLDELGDIPSFLRREREKVEG